MPSHSKTIVDFSGKELTEEDIKDCIQQLREILNADKKFQNVRKDDAYLLRFLHCTDFSVHQAYRRIDDYIGLLLEHPEWFATGSPIDYKDLIDQNTRTILPGVRDRDGRRIFVSKLGEFNVSRMSPQQSAKVDELWLELIMDEPETQGTGLSVILDMKGYSLRMFRWLTPSNIRFGSRKADLYPCKELVYHVVNTSTLISASVKLIWPFLTAKLKERFHFHFDDWESLHKHITPDVLPPEYGGTGPELNFKKLNQWLYDNSEQVYENLKHQHVGAIRHKSQ
ncbi:hypothetical protein PPYR_08130 [Photinus pyralis]|uniref:CRAL-TRIO domain-containing protein n=1 Tax=Photinus pyralis TaxID=7054 RepID=A0A1Y1L5J9_PHOPY|nr:alpha-tocopherol transfer protein-like [Photinus pyralis]KAB0797136.1 hypothetical protein PPYR_08130 [Photinus pyralis]